MVLFWLFNKSTSDLLVLFENFIFLPFNYLSIYVSSVEIQMSFLKISNLFHIQQVPQDLTKHHDDQSIPKVGTVFDSEDELYDFFQKYAYQIGFGICKMSIRTKGEGATRYYSLACAK